MMTEIYTNHRKSSQLPEDFCTVTTQPLAEPEFKNRLVDRVCDTIDKLHSVLTKIVGFIEKTVINESRKVQAQKHDLAPPAGPIHQQPWKKYTAKSPPLIIARPENSTLPIYLSALVTRQFNVLQHRYIRSRTSKITRNPQRNAPTMQ